MSDAPSRAPAWFTDALAHPPEERELEVEGARIRYLTWGDRAAPPLVLVHGGAAHAHWWDHLAPHLARERYVLAPDLSGHGESGWRGRYPRELWAAELGALVEHEDLRDVRLVGHSMGAAVTVTALALVPERFRDGVLVDWGVRPPLEEHAVRFAMNLANRRRPPGRVPAYPSLEAGVERFRLIPAQPRVHEVVLDHVARSGLREVALPDGTRGWRWKFDGRAMLRHSRRPSASYLSRTARPVGLIRGELSRVLSARIARHTRRRLRRRTGAEAPYVVIPGAHHHLVLDHPLEFLDALDRVLTHLAGAVPVAEGLARSGGSWYAQGP